MLPQKYRLTTPMLAMFRDNGQHVARMAPEGAVINIVDGKPFDGERLMEVEWDGRIVMMFTRDLRESAEKWSEAAPRP